MENEKFINKFLIRWLPYCKPFNIGVASILSFSISAGNNSLINDVKEIIVVSGYLENT